MAGPQFYGAISYGESTTGGDDTINYALFDSANTGDYSPLGTQYGNSENAKVQLGLRFDNKIFVELSGSRMQFDGADFGGNGGNNDCTIQPSAGLISDCFDDAAIGFESEVKSTDLIVGWTFAPNEFWTLQPYAGLRRVEIRTAIALSIIYTTN